MFRNDQNKGFSNLVAGQQQINKRRNPIYHWRNSCQDNKSTSSKNVREVVSSDKVNADRTMLVWGRPLNFISIAEYNASWSHKTRIFFQYISILLFRPYHKIAHSCSKSVPKKSRQSEVFLKCATPRSSQRFRQRFQMVGAALTKRWAPSIVWCQSSVVMAIYRQTRNQE